MTCGEFFSEELALAAPHGGFARASHKLAPARDMPLAVAIFWLRVPFTGVGALVGRPGFRAGFARIRARGRGRGSVGAVCSSGKAKGPAGSGLPDCNPQLLSNSLSSKAASLRGRPVFPLYCVFLRHGVQMMAQ